MRGMQDERGSRKEGVEEDTVGGRRNAGWRRKEGRWSKEAWRKHRREGRETHGGNRKTEGRRNMHKDWRKVGRKKNG